MSLFCEKQDKTLTNEFKLGKFYKKEDKHLEFEIIFNEGPEKCSVYAVKQFILRDHGMLKRYAAEATALRRHLLERDNPLFIPYLIATWHVQDVSPVLVSQGHTRI